MFKWANLKILNIWYFTEYVKYVPQKWGWSTVKCFLRMVPHLN